MASDNGGTFSEKTKVPVSLLVVMVTGALTLSGVYYKLQARIDMVEGTLRADRIASTIVQDKRIDAVEADVKTIKQATCALAGAQKIIVSGCSDR